MESSFIVREENEPQALRLTSDQHGVARLGSPARSGSGRRGPSLGGSTRKIKNINTDIVVSKCYMKKMFKTFDLQFLQVGTTAQRVQKLGTSYQIQKSKEMVGLFGNCCLGLDPKTQKAVLPSCLINMRPQSGGSLA